MSTYRTRLLPLLLRSVPSYCLASGVVGVVISYVTTPHPETLDHVRGALSGVLIAFIAVILEAVVFQRGRFTQAPFLVHLTVRSLVYLGVILSALATVFWCLPSPGLGAAEVARAFALPSILASFGFNAVAAVNRLLGPGVLIEFVAGRYHRPRREDRVLLFIDVADSTRTAEELGEVAFLTFLNTFIGIASAAIASHRGKVYKYMGDEVIASWKLAAGIKDARCIRACFDAMDRLAASDAAFLTDFGRRPRFRAALHCGPVVVGELGSTKLEIALIGDTMNTAARIEQACRDTGHDVLASAALIERLPALPPGIAKRSLGPVKLRGKSAELELFALSRG
jgi:adenylate cyclase